MFSVVPSPQLGEASAAAARSIKMLHVTTRTTASQKPRRRVLISPVLVNQSVPCVPIFPASVRQTSVWSFFGLRVVSRDRTFVEIAGKTSRQAAKLPPHWPVQRRAVATRAGVIGRVTTRGVRSERSALRVPIAERVQQRVPRIGRDRVLVDLPDAVDRAAHLLEIARAPEAVGDVLLEARRVVH